MIICGIKRRRLGLDPCRICKLIFLIDLYIIYKNITTDPKPCVNDGDLPVFFIVSLSPTRYYSRTPGCCTTIRPLLCHSLVLQRNYSANQNQQMKIFYLLIFLFFLSSAYSQVTPTDSTASKKAKVDTTKQRTWDNLMKHPIAREFCSAHPLNSIQM